MLCRTFYSNNLHNIVGSVLSVNLNGAIWWNLELNEYFTGASFAKTGITYKKSFYYKHAQWTQYFELRVYQITFYLIFQS